MDNFEVIDTLRMDDLSNAHEVTASFPNNTTSVSVDRDKFKIPEVVAVMRSAHPGEPAIMVKTVKSSNTLSASTPLQKDSEIKVWL